MYEIEVQPFRSPRGQPVSMAIRADSTDYNTVRSCLNEDEYGLAALHLEGTALDIGAHIGGVTIALAVDNPTLSVIAVEAVPPNVELLRRNLDLNGVADRVTVVPKPAGNGTKATVRWAFEGNETADHHAFIGNSTISDLPGVKHREVKATSLSLKQLINGREIAFCKIDCEGCEYDVLKGPALKQIALIHGEIHGIDRHNALELVEQLVKTHRYEQQSDQLPTGFEAVRR